jgi:hypothetical protein
MNTKVAPVKSLTVPPASMEKPERTAKKAKPGLAAYRSVLESLEHMHGKSGDAQVDAVLEQLMRNVRGRLKPWARTVTTYSDTAE